MKTSCSIVCLLLLTIACGSPNPPAASVAPEAPPLALDPEVAGLPEASGDWFDEPIFEQRYYLLRTGAPSADLPPVLLIHGLGNVGVRDFYPVIDALAAERRVLAVDLPGFGRSDHGNHHYAPETYARFVKHVIDTQVPGGVVDVVGHSMGGAIALAHAGQFPEQVRRLVLIDAAGILHREAFVSEGLRTTVEGRAASQRSGRVSEAVGGFANRMLGALRSITPNMDMVLRTGLGRSVLGDSPGTTAAMTLLMHDFGPDIERAMAPTLLLWGKEDTVAPVRTANALYARLPDARLKVLEGVGHAPMSEATDVTREALLAHLMGPVPPATRPEIGPAEGAPADATCTRQDRMVFEGHFRTLRLEGCTAVVVRNARIETLIAENSNGDLTFVEITDGLTASSSELRITGSTLGGDVSLTLDAGRLDLAGVRLEAKQHFVKTTRASRVLFSISMGDRGRGRLRLHGEREIRARGRL